MCMNIASRSECSSLSLRDLEWLFAITHSLVNIVKRNILITMITSLFAWLLCIVLGFTKYPRYLDDDIQASTINALK